MRVSTSIIGVALSGICAGLLAMGTAAASERQTTAMPYGENTLAAPDGSLVRLLDAEQDRVSAILADTVLARLAGLPQTEAPAGSESDLRRNRRIARLAEQDAEQRDAADLLGEVRGKTVTELLIADPGAVIDAEAIDTVMVGDRSAEWRCLAEGLYFEARGESIVGQMAVAEVILNRADSGRYPDTICGVLDQGTGDQLHRCQFSYNCDGKAETISEPRAWERVGKIAWVMMAGRPRTLTDRATHYHADHVRPGWARRMLGPAPGPMPGPVPGPAA
ncbi:MAG: cell wall hydrolase [Pseudomonadota bacterium]